MNFAGSRVCVGGLGLSGAAAARALLAAGAVVTVVDRRTEEELAATAAALRAVGATVVLGETATASPPSGTDLVVTSPGWRPTHPLLNAGVPVMGEVELAWRLRPAGSAPWLAVTGTNGKTTTVGMLACVLQAAGFQAIAAGNVGVPLVEAVAHDPAYDVLAVELSSFQLHWSQTLAPAVAAVLNVAPDHLDWHGSMEAYAAAKGRIYRDGTHAVYNVDDDWSARLAATAAGDRTGFGLGPPQSGVLGVAGGWLVDAGGERLIETRELAVTGSHNVANALAAAGLARAYGVPVEAVAEGLRRYGPGPHRNELVAVVDGIAYVDDSKATNAHAAAASLAAYESVVWLAGGLLKGAAVDDLIAVHASRLRAAVLIGRDRAVIRDALRRHAPRLPVVEVDVTETEPMRVAVEHAHGLARPGDTVLLAPAAASMDMFRDYAERGELFALAARRLRS